MLRSLILATLTTTAIAGDPWFTLLCAPYSLNIVGAKGSISGWKLFQPNPSGNPTIKGLFDNRDTFWDGSDPEFWLRSVTKETLSDTATFNLSGERDTFGRAMNPTIVEVDMSSIHNYCYTIRISSYYSCSEMFVSWVGKDSDLQATFTERGGECEVSFKMVKKGNYWVLSLGPKYPLRYAQAIFLIVESLSTFYRTNPTKF